MDLHTDHMFYSAGLRLHFYAGAVLVYCYSYVI